MRFPTKEELDLQFIIRPRKPFVDLTYQRINQLIVLRYSGYSKKKKSCYFECLCDCGNIKLISERQLRNKRVVSCGCFKQAVLTNNTQIRDRSLDKPRQKKNTISVFLKESFSKIKERAKLLNLSNELTENDIFRLSFANCVYCNDPPSNLFKKRSHRLSYNGIDRIDSALGYTKENSVSCCGTCNYMKVDHPLNYFIQHILKIAQHYEKTSKTSD